MNISDVNSTINDTMDDERNTMEDLLVVTGWAILGSFGLITNVLILIGITTNRKLRNATSYWLIVSLSICDISMLLVCMGHLLPSTALGERYVGLADFANAFGIFIYDAFWYTGVLHLMIMAVNRYVNICRPKYYLKLFSHAKTFTTIVLLYVFGTLIAVPGLFECCYLVFNYKFYAAQFEPADTPYAYADMTVNALSIVIMIFCYTCIVLRVRRSRIMLMQYKRLCREQSAHQSCRNISKFARLLRPTLTMTSRREVRLFFQFATVSIIFFLSFATWGWLPRLSGSKWVGLIVTSLFFINNSTNPTVYLIFNATLRRQLQKLFCTLKLVDERQNAWAQLRNGTANNFVRQKSYGNQINNNNYNCNINGNGNGNGGNSNNNSLRGFGSKRRLKRVDSCDDGTTTTSPCNITAMTAFFNSAVLSTNVFMMAADAKFANSLKENEGSLRLKFRNLSEPRFNCSYENDAVRTDVVTKKNDEEDEDQWMSDQEDSPSIHL